MTTDWICGVETSDEAMKPCALVLGLFALLVTVGCGGGNPVNSNNDGGRAPVAAKVSGTIAVGNNPSAVAVDSTTNKIYAANFGQEDNNGQCQTCYRPVQNGTLTVIDGATQTATTTGFSYTYSNPLDLAVNSSTHNLYVLSRVFFTVSLTCGYSGEVGVFDSSTLTQTATTGIAPYSTIEAVHISVNESTGNVYVADYRLGTVSVLDGSGNLLGTITPGAGPIGLAVNPTTNRIYVANGNSISVIDGTTNSVISTITDPSILSAGAVAVNPTTNTIYVPNGQSCSTCTNPNSLTVIDGASDSVKAIISAGTGLAAIAVDTQTNFIYVANIGGNQPGSVTVINGATNATTTLTDPSLPHPFRIAVNSTTNKIYVANSGSNSVTVIDGAND